MSVRVAGQRTQCFGQGFSVHPPTGSQDFARNLRAEVDCAQLQFGASPDGQTWQSIGPMLDFLKLSDDYGSTLRFTEAMVGLGAQDVGGTNAAADFDYFDYRPTNA